MEKIKYAIFDVDGTLMDSNHIWDTVASAFLMMNGIEPQESNIFRKMGYFEGINLMIEKYGINMTFDEIKGHIENILEFYYSNVAVSKPGVKDFLKKLKDSGVKVTVATATDRKFVEIGLKRNGLLEYIDKIYTTKEVGKRKHFPDVFNACRDFMGADDNLFVFEDALYAIETAKKAGYKVVCIEDYSNDEDKNKLKELADHYVTDYSQMYEIFEF